MTDRRRKSGTPRKHIHPISSYSLGDLVLAKHGEHPYWPAEVRKCSQRLHAYQWKREDVQMLWCNFIDEDCGAWVHIEWVKHFDPSIAKRWQCRKGPYSKSQPAAINRANIVYDRRSNRAANEPNTPPPEPVIEPESDPNALSPDSDTDSNDTCSSSEFQPNPTSSSSTTRDHGRATKARARGSRGRERGRGQSRGRAQCDVPSSKTTQDLAAVDNDTPPKEADDVDGFKQEVPVKQADSLEHTQMPRVGVTIPESKSSPNLLPPLPSHLATVQSAGILAVAVAAVSSTGLPNHLPKARVKPSDVKPSDIDLLLHPTKSVAHLTDQPSLLGAHGKSNENAEDSKNLNFTSNDTSQQPQPTISDNALELSNLKRSAPDSEPQSMGTPQQRKRSRFAPAPPSVLDNGSEKTPRQRIRSSRRWTDASPSVRASPPASAPALVPPPAVAPVEAPAPIQHTIPWTVRKSNEGTPASGSSAAAVSNASTPVLRWKSPSTTTSVPLKLKEYSARKRNARIEETVPDESSIPINPRTLDHRNTIHDGTTQAGKVTVDLNTPPKKNVSNYSAANPADYGADRQQAEPPPEPKSTFSKHQVMTPNLEEGTSTSAGIKVQKTEPEQQSINPSHTVTNPNPASTHIAAKSSTHSIASARQNAELDTPTRIPRTASPKPTSNAVSSQGNGTDGTAVNANSSQGNNSGTSPNEINIPGANTSKPSISASTALTALSPQSSVPQSTKLTNAATLVRLKITELDNMDKISKVDVLKLKWLTLGTVRDEDAKEILPALFDKLKSVVGNPTEVKQQLSELRLIIEGVLTSDNL